MVLATVPNEYTRYSVLYTVFWTGNTKSNWDFYNNIIIIYSISESIKCYTFIALKTKTKCYSGNAHSSTNTFQIRRHPIGTPAKSPGESAPTGKITPCVPRKRKLRFLWKPPESNGILPSYNNYRDRCSHHAKMRPAENIVSIFCGKTSAWNALSREILW